MAYRDPSPYRAPGGSLRREPRPFRLSGPWEVLGPVLRLIAVPLSILLGWPAALFFLASLFSSVLWFSMGDIRGGFKSLLAAFVCGGIVVMAYAPRNSLRR